MTTVEQIGALLDAKLSPLFDGISNVEKQVSGCTRGREALGALADQFQALEAKVKALSDARPDQEMVSNSSKRARSEHGSASTRDRSDISSSATAAPASPDKSSKALAKLRVS